MQTHELNDLIRIYRDGLLLDTVPFWQKHSPDREFGGFFTLLDADGTVVGGDKPIWIQGRATWLFSTLYDTVEAKDEWLGLARHGIDFLTRHAFDTDGRMFYSVTRNGSPLRKRRYLFSEAFAAMAYAAYGKAAQSDAAMDRADEIFRLMLRYHTTPGLLEPKIIPATRQLKGISMPMILLGVSQVLRLYRDKPLYREVANDSIAQIRDHFLKPDFRALLENVGLNGEFLDEPVGRMINPGHAIEVAWFILEEARLSGGSAELINLGLQILDWSLDWGWDDVFGGIIYFRDCRNLPCEQYEHDMKLWWPHNEAIYGTLLAYHLSGDIKYLRWHRKVHDWAYAHFPDRQHGEWFGYLHCDGSISSRFKGNMWKGPFHLPRMQLNCWKLLEEIKHGRA